MGINMLQVDMEDGLAHRVGITHKQRRAILEGLRKVVIWAELIRTWVTRFLIGASIYFIVDW